MPLVVPSPSMDANKSLKIMNYMDIMMAVSNCFLLYHCHYYGMMTRDSKNAIS